MIRAAAPGLVIRAALGILLMPACAPSRVASHPPRIKMLAPPQAFSDFEVALQVEVMDLRPAFHLNVGSGTLTSDIQTVRMTLEPTPPRAGKVVPLESVYWDGGGTFWALAPPKLPVGKYTLVVVGPDGERATLPEAFESLGPDLVAPDLTLDPALVDNSIVGAGTTLVSTLVADDGLGAVAEVHWETTDGQEGDCTPMGATTAPPHLSPSRLRCPVRFSIPTLADGDPPLVTFGLHALATDTATAKNKKPLDVRLRIAPLPTILSFSGSVGALGGSQPFVVHGRDFLPGAQAFIDEVPILGMVLGGDRLDSQHIVGWTPPRNRAGAVRVQVRSEAGTVTDEAEYFNYVAPPNPREVEPTSGPRAGGARITVRGNDLRPDAIVYIGATRETRQALKQARYWAGENKIDACLPPGSGTVSIWVYDAITGDGELPSAFTYDDDEDAAVATLGPGCP